MDRKICEKITNFFENIFLIFFCNGLDLAQKKLGHDRPQIKSGRDWPKKKTRPEPAQKENLLSIRLDLALRVDWTTKVKPEKIVGYCAEQRNQLNKIS